MNEFEGLGPAGREALKEMKSRKKKRQIERRGKEVEQTLQISRRLMTNLPMLVPLEPITDKGARIRGKIVGQWMEEIEEGKKVRMIACMYKRPWADGFVSFRVTLPYEAFNRLRLSGHLVRRTMLVIEDWVRKKGSLEFWFQKGELLKDLGYTKDKLRKGGQIYQLIDDFLLTWRNTQVQSEKGRRLGELETLDVNLIDAVRRRGKGRGVKIYIRLNKEFFGQRQYILTTRDRLTESLPKDQTFALDYIDGLSGFPSNSIGVRKLFTERLGYSSKDLKKMGPGEINKRLNKLVEVLKEKGRLKKPFYSINKKGSKTPLDWIITFYLSAHKAGELEKEILEWMKQSLGYDERNKHKIRTKVSEAVNKWGVQWVREAFEWCEVEGKHPKQFWKEIDEGPSFAERMAEGKI